MDYETFRMQLAKANLTVSSFANLIKMNPTSITNYSTKSKIPAHLAIIVTLITKLADAGIDFHSAIESITLTYKNPRGSNSHSFGGNKQQGIEF